MNEYPWSEQVKQAHRREQFPGPDGFDYTKTWSWEGEPFDKTAPPPGGRWELNVDTADGGYSTKRAANQKLMHIVHWRRRTIPEEEP